MRKANLVLSVVFLALGVLLLASSLGQRGIAITLGGLLGTMLIINGCLRLWLAQKG
ncbi:MAG: hypothetical protein HY664_05375 [Chloroflexi bacterium]|nr:hypothetical protein [Chloroflexota bacterium]